MEERITDAANEYMKLALMLKESAAEVCMDDAPDDISGALLRLYYVKSLEAKMTKCQEMLSEDTDEETVDAVLKAAQTVEETADMVFEIIEKYSDAHKSFYEKIENTVLASDEESLDALLCKLYKCEGIIRLAYRCAKRYPIYDIRGSILGGTSDTEALTDPEDLISGDMDVDIYALLEIRDRLVTSIGKMVSNAEQI
jgi:hypothetical protein